MGQHLTDAIVKRLPVPATGKRITPDDDVPGFGIRVTAGGSRSYILRYVTRGGRERTYTLGSAATWRCAWARDKARELRRLIEDGGDPLADIEDERAAPTVADLIARFRDEHLPRKRFLTRRDYNALLRAHIEPHFGSHAKVADVTFPDIDALHRKITKSGAPYVANRTVAVLSKMFSLAIRWGWRETNPCRGVERNTEYKRRRYLKPDELERLTEALRHEPSQQAVNAVRILLLTGARKGEVLSMRWADLDLDKGTWSKPASSTKQKEDHEVPLSAPVRQLLAEVSQQQGAGETYVFPSGRGSRTGRFRGLEEAWPRICKRAGITNLRLHDLRHSFASQLASGGASLPLIGALLGHSTATTTHRYAHLFADPQRAAVEKVGAVIAAAGKPAKPVVPLKRGGR
jgi:integrase